MLKRKAKRIERYLVSVMILTHEPMSVGIEFVFIKLNICEVYHFSNGIYRRDLIRHLSQKIDQMPDFSAIL